MWKWIICLFKGHVENKGLRCSRQFKDRIEYGYKCARCGRFIRVYTARRRAGRRK